MGGIFSLDGPIVGALGRICDLLILSVLWIVFSLPVVTMGAATTALYTMTLRIVRNEDGAIVRGFWNAFRENLRQSTMIHLILLALAVLLVFYRSAVLTLGGSLQKFFTVVTVLFWILWLMEALFVFPVQARFENDLRTNMKNAWFIAAGNYPIFLLVAVITGLPLWTLLLNTSFFIRTLLLWIFLGPGVIAWLNSFLFHKCFRKYIPDEEMPEEQE